MDEDTKLEFQTRQLRSRKYKKGKYSDDWALGDDEFDGGHLFSIEDKLENERFSHSFVKEMNGADFNVNYLQKNGFTTPLLFREKSGLGLQVPSENFSVNDVRLCVGSRRQLDVMDVNTQKNCEMSMKEWQKYYEDPDKQKLLNVISLEFSHTKLENYVEPPAVVREIDWVNCVWPPHLKEAQTESTNAMDEMMYPKVQKYCLMSVKNCYTDFHIDFGGTSVWYHILRGGKVFWLIPPTEINIQLYEKWVLTGKQGDVFFGDMVDKCGRVTLTAGMTFFIPTGWIHAVYTTEDSLVFGGNFLHSYGVDKQLRIAHVEETTHVPQKFRYPFFTEMLWYVLERYVHYLLGTNHLDVSDKMEDNIKIPKEEIKLRPSELRGLKAIVAYLHGLPVTKKNVPRLIRDPAVLINDVQILVQRFKFENENDFVSGSPVLRARVPKHRMQLKRSYSWGETAGKRGKKRKGENGVKRLKTSAPRRRRTRCKNCDPCFTEDCGECMFCQDMTKFGGPSKMKQTCVRRQCLQPILPVSASCNICNLDGWGRTPTTPPLKMPKGIPCGLMECSACWDIVHPECLRKQGICHDGIVDEDLPNSWECPKCCKDGQNQGAKRRHFKARDKLFHIRCTSINNDGNSTESCFLAKDNLSSALTTFEMTKAEIKIEPSDIKIEPSEIKNL